MRLPISGAMGNVPEKDSSVGEDNICKSSCEFKCNSIHTVSSSLPVNTPAQNVFLSGILQVKSKL